jgi:hypothetical protein
VACTVRRTRFYDQRAGEAWWSAWEEDVRTGFSRPLADVQAPSFSRSFDRLVGSTRSADFYARFGPHADPDRL